MSGIIVTLVLISFVIGGGLFIFWPDLASVIAKPKKEKKKKQAYKSIHAIYRSHYTEEDELIEAVFYRKKHHDMISTSDALARIQKRGEQVKALLSNSGGGTQMCSICQEMMTIKSDYYHIRISCTCDNGRFRDKIMKMLKETGHTK